MSDMRKMLKAKKKEAWLRKMAIVALDQHARIARAQHISQKDFVSASFDTTFNGKNLIADDKLIYYKVKAWQKALKEPVLDLTNFSTDNDGAYAAAGKYLAAEDKIIGSWNHLTSVAANTLSNWAKAGAGYQKWMREFHFESQRDYGFQLAMEECHTFWYTDDLWHAIKTACKIHCQYGRGALFFARLDELSLDLNHKNGMRIWEQFYGGTK